MKRFSLIAVALAFAFTAASPAVRAQVETAPPIKLKSPKPKRLKFKGEVLTANTQQLVVRSRENSAIVRTFSYTLESREKMQKIIDRGGYQHGDKIEVEYEAGSDVAIKFKGKPSKPI
jgi:Spy/CpxP family protein refolding chaperone